MTQQEQAHGVDEVLVATQIEVEVAAHAATTVESDLSFEILRHVPGILERFPGAFEEVPMLGVEDRSFLRTETKELPVKEIHAVEWCASLDVARAPNVLELLSCVEQLLLGVGANGLHPIAHVAPILGDVFSPR